MGWYQCTTKYSGETISSIGYFLNIHHIQLPIESSAESSNGEHNSINSHDNNVEDLERSIEESLLEQEPSLEANSHKDGSMTQAESVTSSEKLSGKLIL